LSKPTVANQWAIFDDVGILYQGTEEEMRAIWDNLDEIYMKQEDRLHPSRWLTVF